MEDLKAILLDMDGVVIDSEPLHEEAQRVIFREYDLRVPESEFPTFKGMTEVSVFTRIVDDYASEPLNIAELVEAKTGAYRKLLGDVQLIPRALDFIRAASEEYRLALVTSSLPEEQRFAFELFDLSRYFEVVTTAKDITNPKPHPEPYALTAEKLGVDPCYCLVVEDSLNGARSGLAAGCRVAGLTTSFDAERLRDVGVGLTIDSFEELAGRLGLSLVTSGSSAA